MTDKPKPRPGGRPDRGGERRDQDASTAEGSGGRRQRPPAPGPLSELHRAVVEGEEPVGDRLRAAADQAAAMVASGQVDRVSAVTALWLSAQAAGIGSSWALAAILAAFRRAGVSA